MDNREVEPKASPGARKAVGFLRVPGDAPEPQRKKALLDQEASFVLFCDREGFEAADIFAEADHSEDGAVSYSQMLRYLRENREISVVVVSSVDVLSNGRDNLAISLLELEELGATVHLADGRAVDPFSVLTGSWPKSVEQSTVMRERIKAAMRNRAIRGEGLGKPPYGYHIGPSRKLEIVQDEAEVVRLIYSLYTQRDLGIRLIVRHLNENKIPTRKGRNWSMVTIRDILRNRAYLGTYTRFGLRVPGSHPAVITPDMFRWAQAELEQRRPSRKDVQAEPFLLSGMVYCGYCGNRMVGVTRRQTWTRRRDGSRAEKEYRYYQCQSRTNQGICEYHTHKSLDLEAGVLEFLQQHRPRLAALKGRRGALSPSALQRENRRLEAAREKAETRLKRNIKQVFEGKLSLQRFRPLSAELLRSRRLLLERLDRLQQGDDPASLLLTAGQQAAQSIDKLAAEWESIPFGEKRLLLQSLVDQVNIFDDHFQLQLRPELAEQPVAPSL